ncbi:hypothetical protein L0668_08625 [Paraglaciecola aquimarina]|uniref:Uncharacterized protein n=1 Tax=Paraglaciecola algarum TaxID=3050085 RepID=A0ABS9D6X1_9ALTE|nr:hypothetical protein [Paraglaciecola sp. G1-23]MCF2948167.1 hypothetical protein [Paraglaciecola sp. G1-23]
MVWSHHLDVVLQQPNVNTLDVGAGVGRDASYLATKLAIGNKCENNSSVYAVEPAIEILKVKEVIKMSKLNPLVDR